MESPFQLMPFVSSSILPNHLQFGRRWERAVAGGLCDPTLPFLLGNVASSVTITTDICTVLLANGHSYGNGLNMQYPEDKTILQ